MSLTLTFQGVDYSIPTQGESDDWGNGFNDFLSALAAANPALTLTLAGTAAAAPLCLTPGTQPTGPNAAGALYVTAGGVLKVCTVAGTPGTWVSVGSQT